MAMASENSERSQPNSSAIGIWNTPNEARTAKLIMIMTQPTIKTGVNKGVARGMGSLLLIKWQDHDLPDIRMATVAKSPHRSNQHFCWVC